MTFPNDQFYQAEAATTNTPLASMLINGKEYPVVLIAQQSGHLKGSLDTWTALADAVAFAANKQMIAIFNGVGSGKILRLRKLFLVDLALVAVTGVAVRLDLKKTTAQSVGTPITPVSHDSQNIALPAQLLFATGATVTEGPLWLPITFANDEVGATQAFPSNLIMQATNWLPEGEEIEELTLREGQGFTAKMITSTLVGTLGLIVILTVE